jgi:hypothetical protein
MNDLGEAIAVIAVALVAFVVVLVEIAFSLFVCFAIVMLLADVLDLGIAITDKL